jgi:predicted phage replisome organizer
MDGEKMSDNKKYYYLKVKENFYETEELIVLQSMQDGYLYSDILMKLYLRSLKSEGKLMFRDRIPYNPTVLAQVVRHSVGVVEKALNVFKELELIEILDNGAIYMLDIQSLIGRGSSEAERKAKYRKKIENNKKLLGDGTMSHEMSGQSPGQFPPEIELELEIELEREKEKETKSGTNFLSSSTDEPLSPVDLFFEKIWGMYPRKNGKSKIPKNQKKVLYGLGDEIIRCVQRYKKDPELKLNGGWKETLSGNSFFNKRYLEWTDKEFEKYLSSKSNELSEAEIRKNRVFEIYKKNKGDEKS